MELVIRNLTKQYPNKLAVDGVNLTLRPGVYGLLGANGAGKTTLMRMLCGILHPTGGGITLDGLTVDQEDYRASLGYLPQDFGYYPGFTGMDFLLYLGALKGLPRPQAKARAAELLDLVGLSEVAKRKLKTYSGGMKQRLGIAQALLNHPQLLILDEPTAGLDPKERVRFRDLIAQWGEHCIVLLSTHIVSDIETIAGQIVMFRDHRLYCCDSPARICAQFQGRVFQLPAGTALAPGQFLLSEGQGEDGLVLRVLCDTPPIGGAMVTSGLEDAFLAIYREGQP